MLLVSKKWVQLRHSLLSTDGLVYHRAPQTHRKPASNSRVRGTGRERDNPTRPSSPPSLLTLASIWSRGPPICPSVRLSFHPAAPSWSTRRFRIVDPSAFPSPFLNFIFLIFFFGFCFVVCCRGRGEEQSSALIWEWRVNRDSTMVFSFPNLVMLLNLVIKGFFSFSFLFFSFNF